MTTHRKVPVLADHVARWRRGPGGRELIADVRVLPARPSETTDWPDTLHPLVRRAMHSRGVERPYLHQAAAWAHLDAGEDLVVTTPTASGKSLCAHAHVLDLLVRGDDGTALYLYPTRALAQDQAAELAALMEAAGLDDRPHVYDGDTPAESRAAIRGTARVVLSNPDMLHAAILPHHVRWRRFLSQLRYVVVDEAHVCRGVFGSHVANVFRRLRRVCAHLGASPVWVLFSATIANPVELGELLIGRPPRLVARSGAPSGPRTFALVQPPLFGDEPAARRLSPVTVAVRLAVPLLRDGASVVFFARSRQGVERLTRMLRERLEQDGEPGLAARVEGYRGGYLADERRRIEAALRNGDVQAVVATNALELGVDIGSLDVCVLVGYPGTIASTWQQAGRAGRRGRDALVVLVAGDDPHDQYLLAHPDWFFAAPAEHARLNPDNLAVVLDHLRCAVHELPVAAGEAWGGLSTDETDDLLAWIVERGTPLVHRNGAWHPGDDVAPARGISLRSLSEPPVVILDVSRDPPQVIGHVDASAAPATVHPHAIYTHGGRVWQVESFDPAVREARVRPTRTDCFTQAVEESRVFVLDTRATSDVPPVPRGLGEIRISTRWVGFRKVRLRTRENVGFEALDLPALERHTTATWFVLRATAFDAAGVEPSLRADVAAALARALHLIATLRTMSDPTDLEWLVAASPADAAPPRQESDDPPVAPLASDPTIWLFDRTPGGVGLAERIWELATEILPDVRALVSDCPCPSGCPRCVGPEGLSQAGVKRATLLLLRTLT